MLEFVSFIMPRLFRGALLTLVTLLLAVTSSWSYAAVAVIGHEGLEAMDKTVVSRVFTGRTVEVGGRTVLPVNLKAGDKTRGLFFRAVLQQSDDDYVAYWIVRRAIGKGIPPVEVSTAQAMIDFVRSTPGAIGYVDANQLAPGVKVMLVIQD
jgi:hypothetical protein